MVRNSFAAGAGLGLVALAAAGALGYWLWTKRDKFNPVSRDNVAYSTVNEVGASVTGDKYWSLGSWIYEISHPEQVAKERAVSGPVH